MTKSDPEGRDLYAIAELANEFGISTRAIRFYEAKGLISPERVGGTRVFRRRDRARLTLILRGKRLGFSLKEIQEYLALYDADPGQAAQTSRLIELIDDRLNLLQAQMADIKTTVEELEKIRTLALEEQSRKPSSQKTA